MQLRCPRCSHFLQPHAAEGLAVDHCISCGGTWFDRGELEIALANAATFVDGPPRPTAVDTEVRYLKCPHCRDLMTRRTYERFSGTILDYCNAHGVWADSGEVDKARAFRGKGGLTVKARKEAEEARLERSLASYGVSVSPRASMGLDWVDVMFDIGADEP